MGLDIKVASPEEAEAYIAKAKSPKAIHFSCGGGLVGSAELVCRDNDTGKVVWEHKADNVITDHGRRRWFEEGITTAMIFTHPSTETPDYRRSSLAGPYDGNAIAYSPYASVTGSWSWATYQKTWSFNFTSPPGAIRTIGTVGLYPSPGYAPDFQVGVQHIYSYLLMTPVKTQTSSQTLEVVYKITFQPNI